MTRPGLFAVTLSWALLLTSLAWGAAPALQFLPEPALVTVNQHAGPNELTVDPPQATLFGRTALPLRVKVLGPDGKPLAAAQVTLDSAGSSSWGLAEAKDALGNGKTQLSVTTGEDGLTPRVYVFATDLWTLDPQPAVVTIKATYGAVQATQDWEVVDNRARILGVFEVQGPRGGWHQWLEDLVLTPETPVGSGFFYARFFQHEDPWWQQHLPSMTCQGQVLDLLNRLRADPYKAWLFNGLEYGPVQSLALGPRLRHFATVLWPTVETWMQEGLLLDPWPTQKPKTFTILEWKLLFGMPTTDTTNFTQNVPEGYLSPYPTHIPHGPYPSEGYGNSVAAPTDGSPLMVIVESPVELAFTDRDNKVLGYSDGAFTIKQKHPGRWSFLPVPEEEGGAGKLVFVPDDRQELTLVGLEDGTFSLHLGFLDQGPCEGECWGWQNYEEVPIAKGETLRFNLDRAHRCQPGVGKDGRILEPSGECPRYATWNFPLDTTSPAPDTGDGGSTDGDLQAADTQPVGGGGTGGGGGCQTSPQAPPTTTLLLLTLAAALALRRRSRAKKKQSSDM
jgi:MYXO-CTERM domain-containing protein